MRPPIDPARTYTLMSDVVARRRLASEFGVPRHESARMGLDELHDALTARLPEGFAAHLLVMTERSYAKVMARSDELLRRFYGAPIDPGASIISYSAARGALEEVNVDIPVDADLPGLEDAISGLRGSRHMIVADEDFTTYGREMAAAIAREPTGRAKQ